MPIIKPCADLRNNYNEISRLCHETNKPIYITKNGYNDLVILSSKDYDKYEDYKIDKLISIQLEKKFPDFESFKKDVYKKIEEGLEDIENNRYCNIEEFCSKMENKYKINE